MKFIKNPNMWFAVALLYTLVIGPIQSTITSHAGMRTIKMDGRSQIVFVDREKASIYIDVPGGRAILFAQDGKVMKKTVLMPVMRPTMFIISSASNDEQNFYHCTFAKV